jgi:nucleoside-diphosphate-sugar epimerase
MKKIALFGAAGAIGRSIADALRAEGREYRVVGRNGGALQKTFGADPLAEIVTWNPDDPESVRAAARGVDTLIYLVGVPYNHFELHPVLMRKTLDGAIAEGVEHVVLIGTVYPYGLPTTTPVTEAHPRNPHTFKGKMRKAQEDELLKAHGGGRYRGQYFVCLISTGRWWTRAFCTRCLRRRCGAGRRIWWGRSIRRMSLCMCRMLGRWFFGLRQSLRPMAGGGTLPARVR